MSKKKIVYIVVLILFVVLVGIAIFNNIEIKDNNEANTVLEYVPEQEISDEQNRMTIVTLYFLIEGSEDENLKNTIPEGTVLNLTTLNGEEIEIDFNENFAKDCDENPEMFKNRVYSVVDTLLEFKDISSVKILINGEQIEALKDSFTKRDN